ncbi:MAG: 4Fe-4S dicluster domain-containing protein [Promethearchaeota archaeon]
MQVGFYFDQTRCTGCHACEISCKDWHDIPAGPMKWIRVLYNEEGTFPNVFVSYLIQPCYHCIDPVCLAVCPVKAIFKREKDGIVLVDSSKCLGNEECDSKCLKACPYDAPQFGAEPGSIMQKCNFCADRFALDLKPICVEACRTRALDAGPLEELKKDMATLKRLLNSLTQKEQNQQ